MSPDVALRELGPSARGARVIGRLHSGVTKTSFLVARGRARFVLRVDLPLAQRLRLDRRAEAGLLQVACDAGVGPELIAWRAKAPAIFLSRYVPGCAWRRADLGDRRRLEQLAALLRRVHGVPVVQPRVELTAAAGRYAQMAGEGRARVHHVGRLLERARDPDAPVVLCHHDPIAANVVGFRRPCLIDWEYASAGDPLFDLAVVIAHHRLPRRAAGYLLTAYFGSASAVPAERVATYVAIYRHLLALWQAATGAIRKSVTV